MVWFAATDVAVVPWEPGLDQGGVDDGSVCAACELGVWVAPPEGWGEGGAVFVEAEGLEGVFDSWEIVSIRSL